MSSVESIVLWLCLGALLWMVLGFVSMKNGITKLLIEHVELKSKMENLKLQISELNDHIRKFSVKRKYDSGT